MPKDFLTDSYWLERLHKSYEEFNSDQAVRFFIFTQVPDQEVVGILNFTQIFRGPFQACYLGYAIGKRFEGRGLMSEALQAAIQYVFQEKNIHRIMANYLPENQRSARILQRLGFTIEGQAKDYLFINGNWRDHVLTSLSNSNWSNR